MTAKLMKGHTWAAGKKRIKFPVVAEIKVDEIRLDVRRGQESSYYPGEEGQRVVFRSYADKPLHNIASQFEHDFRRAMEAFDIERLDMGVIVNGTFKDTYRYVRSSKGVPADLLGAKVEFILFDVPDHGEVEFNERYGRRSSTASILRDYGLPIYTPQWSLLYSEEAVTEAYETARDRGYEGLMVKTLDHKYEEGKRSYGWLKVKPENEADAKIIAINRAYSMEGVPLGRAGSIEVLCEDGSVANVPGIAHDLGRALLANPQEFIGQWLVFEYMERDRQGGYRHPRLARFREDKE